MTRERHFLKQWVGFRTSVVVTYAHCVMIGLIWGGLSVISNESSSPSYSIYVLFCAVALWMIPFSFELSGYRENSFIHGRPLCQKVLLMELRRAFITGHRKWVYALVAVAYFVISVLSVTDLVTALNTTCISYAAVLVVSTIAIRSQSWLRFSIVTAGLALLTSAVTYLTNAMIVRVITDQSTGIIDIVLLKIAERGLLLVLSAIVLILCSVPFTNKWLFRLVAPTLVAVFIYVGTRSPLPKIVPPTVSLSPPSTIYQDVPTAFSLSKQKRTLLRSELTTEPRSVHLPIEEEAWMVTEDGRRFQTEIVRFWCLTEAELSAGVLKLLFPNYRFAGQVPEVGSKNRRILCDKKPAVTYSSKISSHVQPNLIFSFSALRPVVDYIEPLTGPFEPFSMKIWDVSIRGYYDKKNGCSLTMNERQKQTLTALRNDSQYAQLVREPTMFSNFLYFLLDHDDGAVKYVGEKHRIERPFKRGYATVPCEVLTNPARYSIARVSFVVDGMADVNATALNPATP